MIVGVLQIELLVTDAAGLKDKRRVLLSLKDRIGQPHSIAVAEVDATEAHQRTVIGVATVSNSGRHARQVLDTIVAKLRDDPRVQVVDHRIEILTGQ